MTQQDDTATGTAGFLLEMGMLKRAKRSGWWIAGVKDPETIAEHSFRTGVIGAVLAMTEGVDPAKVALLCLFHDTQETRVGGIPHIGRRYLQAASNESVVRPHDPLAPGQVLDRAAEVGELPVDHRGDLERHRVQEHVVGPEVAVDQHLPDIMGTRPDDARRGLMDAAQQYPAGLQDLRRATGVHQFLARRTGDESEGEDSVVQAVHGGHGQLPLQPGQQGVFPCTAEPRIGTFVGLLHHRTVADGAVVEPCFNGRIHGSSITAPRCGNANPALGSTKAEGARPATP
jgi:hypothetical protein